MKTDVEKTASRLPLLANLISTFLGIGHLRPGPGSWASLAAVLIWWALTRPVPASSQPLVLAIITSCAIAAGIPAATSSARFVRIKDPQFVVIDEVAGQWLTLLFVPVTWKTMLAGFILFRGFDILKPPPVRQLERLPEGLGIVLDDVAAGVYGQVVMQALLYFGFFSR